MAPGTRRKAPKYDFSRARRALSAAAKERLREKCEGKHPLDHVKVKTLDDLMERKAEQKAIHRKMQEIAEEEKHTAEMNTSCSKRILTVRKVKATLAITIQNRKPKRYGKQQKRAGVEFERVVTLVKSNNFRQLDRIDEVVWVIESSH